ncbi:MAG TPA: hypothetical protein VHM31_14775 [Polyangia bacterium]|nr:hypothetical protein [Polyangia bacterium]
MTKRLALALAVALGTAGCDPQLDVGSDLLWTARFETNGFDEWTASRFGGSFGATPTPPNTIAVSSTRAHSGVYGALLTIDAGSDGALEAVSMSLRENLPTDAYYSAWYYLTHTTTVNGYWVIQKFRRRTDAADPSTEGELFDIDLYTLASGEMSLRVFDHRSGGNTPMLGEPPVVPVGRWFQVEARYRNAADATGRLTVWLDGLEVVDLSGPTGPSPWLQWVVSSLGEDLTPSGNVLYADDCAIAGSRVGPTGLLPGP